MRSLLSPPPISFVTKMLLLLTLLSPAVGGNIWFMNATDKRVVGGSPADPTRYPYFAHISVHVPSGTYQCGGILITSDLILSAAHCVQDLGQIMGIHAVVNMTKKFDAYDGVELGPTGWEQIRNVQDFRQHPRYNPVTQAYDALLLSLEFPVVGIPLPDIPSATYEAPEGAPVTVIGFGDTQARSSFPDELMEVEVDMISFDDCNHRDSFDGHIDQDSMICAASPGKDACIGDSGGPLLIRTETNSELEADIIIGLVSFGVGCAREKYPGVYSKVSAFGDFVIGEGLCNMSLYNIYPDEMCDPYREQVHEGSSVTDEDLSGGDVDAEQHYEIPAEDPPEEDPPAEDPPAEDPPAEDPPAEDSLEEDPPAEDPLEEDPQVEDPLEEDPPEEDPPEEDPPEEDPPVEDPPEEDPPVEDPPVIDPDTDFTAAGDEETQQDDKGDTPHGEDKKPDDRPGHKDSEDKPKPDDDRDKGGNDDRDKDKGGSADRDKGGNDDRDKGGKDGDNRGKDSKDKGGPGGRSGTKQRYSGNNMMGKNNMMGHNMMRNLHSRRELPQSILDYNSHLRGVRD